nr:MAG TPA: hypothetical protein [Caudoviricetes sp.]
MVITPLQPERLSALTMANGLVALNLQQKNITFQIILFLVL